MPLIFWLVLQLCLDEQPLFNHSHFSHSPFELDIQHANGVRYITVKRHGEEKLRARIFCAGTDPLSMCSPTGINGWTYTQKLTTLAVEGFSLINKVNELSLMSVVSPHSMILVDF